MRKACALLRPPPSYLEPARLSRRRHAPLGRRIQFDPAIKLARQSGGRALFARAFLIDGAASGPASSSLRRRRCRDAKVLIVHLRHARPRGRQPTMAARPNAPRARLTSGRFGLVVERLKLVGQDDTCPSRDISSWRRRAPATLSTGLARAAKLEPGQLGGPSRLDWTRRSRRSLAVRPIPMRLQCRLSF